MPYVRNDNIRVCLTVMSVAFSRACNGEQVGPATRLGD
jgi:hypothetical protein